MGKKGATTKNKRTDGGITKVILIVLLLYKLIARRPT